MSARARRAELMHINVSGGLTGTLHKLADATRNYLCACGRINGRSSQVTHSSSSSTFVLPTAFRYNIVPLLSYKGLEYIDLYSSSL